MSSILDRLARAFGTRRRCCPRPPAVSGIRAVSGGGSAEVVITWDPLPAGANVRFYRVYQKQSTGTWWHLAIVTEEVLGSLAPGKVGIVDFPANFPWPSGLDPTSVRCYRVSAVSTRGLEGALSAEVCAAGTA